ncbi:MAG: hypothetical protein ACHQYP_09135 [Nitrospiria bacterium]
MKAKSKSSKKVTKKPAAKKTVKPTIKKKKATAKPVKKVASAKKARKASPKKTVKRPAAKKKAVTSTQKKKTPLKPVKRSAAIKKPAAVQIPMTIIEETIVTVTATMPGNGNGVPSAPPPGLLVGKVTHYYNHSNVAIIELDAGDLQVGDTIHIKGHTTDFEQVVESMEIEDQNIVIAELGQTIGLKVRDVVREHDQVYKKEG